ncbi:MAG TPA: DUF1343 domain-containing protein [Polyangiaceae bacterium]|nr:DUF1343 domain-containing protein [Polyangiaceae bacterium]
MWGIDRLSAGELGNTRRRLRNSAVGLLTQASAVDRHGRPVLDVLDELGVRPVRIFAGEHGFNGVAQAEEAVLSQAAPLQEQSPAARTADALPELGRDSAEASGEGAEAAEAQLALNLPPSEPKAPSLPPPIISLYGTDRASLSPQPEHLAGLDVLLIDLMDVGSRYYTFVWTALLAARAAAQAGVHTLVLDRPNPISGDPGSIEGAPQAPGYTSFVGLESLPIRHAMTVGELLVHFMARDGHALGPDGALSVVAPRGWERLRTAHAWSRPFVAPSPNMPSVETALVYPGGCLIEGTNLSEGRGTTLPFQTVGAPFLDGAALARSLVQARLPGLMVRPQSFRPSFEKHAGQLCHGVVIHVTDPASFRPVTTYLTLLALARQQAPEAFAFRTHTYEFENSIPAFDLLTGSDAARQALLAGASAEALVELVAPAGEDWPEQLRALESLVARAHA